MNLKEYQESIRQEFIKEGRPVTARERYYTFSAIRADYPEQFPEDRRLTVHPHTPTPKEALNQKVSKGIPQKQVVPATKIGPTKYF